MAADKEAARLQRTRNMKDYFRVLAFLPYFYLFLYYLNVLLLFLIHKKPPVTHLVGEHTVGISPLVNGILFFVVLSVPFFIFGIPYYLIRRVRLDWRAIIIYLLGLIFIIIHFIYDPFLARELGE